jgi:hypothetical protein
VSLTDERNRVEWLKARLAVLDKALAYRAPPITPRDFQVTRQTSLTVHRHPEDCPHDFAPV